MYILHMRENYLEEVRRYGTIMLHKLSNWSLKWGICWSYIWTTQILHSYLLLCFKSHIYLFEMVFMPSVIYIVLIVVFCFSLNPVFICSNSPWVHLFNRKVFSTCIRSTVGNCKSVCRVMLPELWMCWIQLCARNNHMLAARWCMSLWGKYWTTTGFNPLLFPGYVWYCGNVNSTYHSTYLHHKMRMT